MSNYKTIVSIEHLNKKTSLLQWISQNYYSKLLFYLMNNEKQLQYIIINYYFFINK